MNFEQPIAALFPGASGRVVDTLAKLVAQGEPRALHLTDLAREASVTLEQTRKILIRLALLGLVEFPAADQVALVSDHMMWPAICRIAAPHNGVDSYVRSLLSTVSGVQAIAVSGPVAAGTARSYPDGLYIALVVTSPIHVETIQNGMTTTLARGLGNSCHIVLASSLAEAKRILPDDGYREIWQDESPDAFPRSTSGGTTGGRQKDEH